MSAGASIRRGLAHFAAALAVCHALAACSTVALAQAPAATPRACRTAADCASGDVCWFASAGCGPEIRGTCGPAAPPCTAHLPVCACDGTTTGSCFPTRASVPFRSRGPCGTPSPDAGAGSSGPVRIRALLPAIGLEVTNTGPVTIEVRREIQVERLAAGAWQPLAVSNLTLRPSCAIGPDHALVNAPPCVALAPGATRTAPPWLVTVGDGQCICERCGSAPPGPYRYVLRACNGDRVFVGEPFAPPFPAPRRAR